MPLPEIDNLPACPTTVSKQWIDAVNAALDDVAPRTHETVVLEPITPWQGDITLNRYRDRVHISAVLEIGSSSDTDDSPFFTNTILFYVPEGFRPRHGLFITGQGSVGMLPVHFVSMPLEEGGSILDVFYINTKLFETTFLGGAVLCVIDTHYFIDPYF